MTWTVEGKTQTRIIPVEAVEQTQAQIAEYRRARALTRELFEVSTRMCDVQLHTVKAVQRKSSPRRSSGVAPVSWKAMDLASGGDRGRWVSYASGCTRVNVIRYGQMVL